MHRLLATPIAVNADESVYECPVKESPVPSLRRTPMPLISCFKQGSKFATPMPAPAPRPNTKSVGKRRRATPAVASGVLKHKKHTSVLQAPRKTFNASTPAPKSAFTAALIESRNKRQVGIAILNLRSPELDLYTLADNPTYSSIIRLMHLYDPAEILMSDTSIGSNLHTILNRELEFSRVTVYQRKYFNEDQGQLTLEQKATKDSLKQLGFDPALFLCLAASNCLLKWVAFEQSETFGPHSIKVTHKTLDGHMTLCMSTVKNLEILSNAIHPKMKKGALLSAINFCKTPLGERLLRSNLMQPLNRVQAINDRLDAVEELLENEDTFFSLIEAIPHFASLDLVNNGLAMVSNAPNERTAQQSITNLLFLKQALKSIPTITEGMKCLKSRLLVMIVIGLSNSIRESIVSEIDEVISEDAAVTDKMPIHILHTKLAFAVKPGLNGLLDVGRATYCEIIEAIHEEIESYTKNYDLPTLRKHFNATRGFYLSLPLTAASDLPDIFIQVVQHGKRINFSTADLISLDDRRKESLYDVLILTERCLQDLTMSIRKNLDYLLNVAENIALLDLLLNFATLVTQNESYVRPNITQDGPIAISKGRHPIKEIISKFPFIPNDVYLNEVSTLQIVTGPNGAGKSTYLRQVALLVVLCHIGSFVPAAYASVPVIDQIFTRMTHGDNIEGNISGFMLEAQEASTIVRSATKASLVLIDEFGRSTSTVDGVGLAWALIEELISRQCYCLFATHYHELTEMKSLYPQIKNVQLKVSQVDRRMNFCYSVVDGFSNEIIQHYGIQIAELALFPPEMISFARQLSESLRKKFSTTSPENPSTSCFYNTIQKLMSLRHCNLSIEDTVLYLRQIREDLLLHYQTKDVCEPEECSQFSNESKTRDDNSRTGSPNESTAKSLFLEVNQ